MPHLPPANGIVSLFPLYSAGSYWSPHRLLLQFLRGGFHMPQAFFLAVLASPSPSPGRCPTESTQIRRNTESAGEQHHQFQRSEKVKAVTINIVNPCTSIKPYTILQLCHIRGDLAQNCFFYTAQPASRGDNEGLPSVPRWQNTMATGITHGKVGDGTGTCWKMMVNLPNIFRIGLYTHIHAHTHTHVYIYIYIGRDSSKMIQHVHEFSGKKRVKGSNHPRIWMTFEEVLHICNLLFVVCHLWHQAGSVRTKPMNRQPFQMETILYISKMEWYLMLSDTFWNARPGPRCK